ncbi:hypothetical protein ACMFMG_001840 [Clarireedia jacksonii]
MVNQNKNSDGGRGLGPRTRTHRDKSSNKPSSHHTGPSNHDSSSSAYQSTTLTPQSLYEHNLRQDKLHQNPQNVAATRIEQTQRLQQGLQALGVDIPSDLYQARVSGYTYTPYSYNGVAPPTHDSNGLHDDDDEMNDILSDEQLFQPTKDYAQPLSNDYAMQGMPWTANYFPQNWRGKNIVPAHEYTTPQSYSNNYYSPIASPSATQTKNDEHFSDLIHKESTHEYDNINNPASDFDGIGEQFASYGSGFEGAYQDDNDIVDCGW